jgi:hypothetical protein
MVHAGCWAHARRYFIDALKVHPADGLAAEFVRRIDELFAVDRGARAGGLSQSERAELRRERSAKIVAELRERLEAERHRVLPKSKSAEGIQYTLGQWGRLTKFLEYPELELSNNLAENSMRPAVLGRKNWIHVGSVEAGPKVAAILSGRGELSEDGDSGATVSAQRTARDGRPEGERGSGADPNGLVATAAGLAESQKLRKAGDGRPLTVDRETDGRQERLVGMVVMNPAKPMYEYAVLVTTAAVKDVLSVAQLYRDRADAENISMRGRTSGDGVVSRRTIWRDAS